jgi:hypothetical protein
LIIGNGDVIPLAVAFQEVISAKFKGTDESRCQVQMFGNVKIAFPSGIVQTLANNPSPAALAFKLTNAAKIEKLHPNRNFVTVIDDNISLQPTDEYQLEIDVSALVNHLKRLREQNPTARYYNVDIVKYQLKSFGVKSCPLQVVTHWKCEPKWTGLKVEFKYNPAALSSLESVKNITFTVNIDAKVIDIQGKPQPTWDFATKQATWRLDDISRKSNETGLGSLRAKFDVIDGPCSPTPVTVQFSCSDATLSGLGFEMNCTGYRVSLIKKSIVSSRYTSEADSNINYACI